MQPSQAASSPEAGAMDMSPQPTQPIVIGAGAPMVEDPDGLMGDMPTKGDQVEEGLYVKYKSDLWMQRAHKPGMLLTPAASSSSIPPAPQGLPQPAAKGALPIKMEADGSFTLQPRWCGGQR